MVWLLGIRDRSKELPASRCKCLLGSVPTVSTFSKDNDAKKYRHWRLMEVFTCILFVCLFVALCSLLCFVSPHFCRAFFFLLLTLSLFCRVELTLTHFFLARKKMDDNSGGGGGGGF